MYDCLGRSNGSHHSRSSRQQNKLQETAMRVTADALVVRHPIWMIGDSAYDTLDWHDHLLEDRGRANRPVRPPATPTIRLILSTGSKTASKSTARPFSSNGQS